MMRATSRFIDKCLLAFALWQVTISVQAALTGRLEESNSIRVYVSTFSEAGLDGIHVADLDRTTGRLENLRLAATVKKASFLVLHPNHRYLYATCEIDRYEDSKGGAVAAFVIDADTGKLTLLNHQSSKGIGPHYVSLDRDGKHALVANYHGGSVAVLPIGSDGKLQPASSTVSHRGSSINKNRQEGPHPHAFNADPAGRFAFVPDLGLDQVVAYTLNSADGSVTPHVAGTFSTSPGAGPRHMTFHPSGKWAYVINELDSTVIALDYDANVGVLKPIQTISTLPAGCSTSNITGEIAVHPNGRFLYASNRGHDSIAVYAIDESNGRLDRRDCFPAEGRAPRNFNIDPRGELLLSANLDSNSITVHRLDPESGALRSAGNKIEIHQPFCIEFAPRD